MKHLRYFVEVASSGSLRSASEKLHVAASAIGRHIQLMEEEAGTALFERHARGMVVTEAGEVYLRYARNVLSESEQTYQHIGELRTLQRGHVRLSSIDGIVSGPLLDIIADFRARYPGITLHLRTMGTEDVIRAVRDGEADIGIAFYASPMPMLRIAKRVPDPLCAIVHPDHELANRPSVSLAELLMNPIALPEKTFGIRKLVDAACHIHQLQPNIVLETNSIEALRAFARAGAGITMMPYLSAKREVGLGAVKSVWIDEDLLKNSSVDICLREERILPPAVAEFELFLTSRLGAPGR